MDKELQYVWFFMLIFGLLGSFFGGVNGAVLGVILGLATGIITKHKHVWECGVVYDDRGQPCFMVKFCRCGEIRFDGLFAKKEES